MAYDVVVVGAGIGGLTVAALLAKRGVNTCVLERQSQVGGCIGRVEFSGYAFDPGMGLYPSWEPGGIYDRLFAELGASGPSARLTETDYVVRLSEGDVQLRKNDSDFFEELRRAFPDSADAAVDFYKEIIGLNEGSTEHLAKGFGQRLKSIFSTPSLKNASKQSVLSVAQQTSPRFQRFVDAQLQAFLQTGIDRCTMVSASKALSLPRRNLYSIDGGISTLAEHLAQCIRNSGGNIRLSAPVLRLAYNETGEAIGVDLLNGETVLATQAIISNLTLWDTFGKLIGLNRTPADLKKRLSRLEGNGVYVIYAALDEAARARLPGPNILVVEDDAKSEPKRGSVRSSTKRNFDENLSGEFTITVQAGNRNDAYPTTIKAGTQVGPWFSFQTSEEDYLGWDQAALEIFWSRLHRSVPEFGAGIEVIETANPRTYYDLTRRKLGMVMGTSSNHDPFDADLHNLLPNVFAVGDTIADTPFLSSVVESAVLLVDRITK